MTLARVADWLRQRAWLGLALGYVPWVAWTISLSIGGWKKDHEGTLIGGDHLAFYTAARLIRDGDGHRVYSYAELHADGYQHRLIGWVWGGENPAFEAFRNPPFYALLYLPTAGLSFYQSLAVWSGIGFGLLVLALVLLKPARPGVWLVGAFAFYPVYAVFSFGQNTFLSLAIFAGVYRLLTADRKLTAGLVAGLLWFKPQLLLGLFIWWAFEPRRYWRCWLGVALTGLVLAAVSWVAVPDVSRAFIENLGTNVGFGGFGLWNAMTPKAFLVLLVPGAGWAHGPLGLACSLAAIVTAWRIGARTGAPVAVMFPVAVYLSLWASPHALVYEWALLLAAGAVLWDRLPTSRNAWTVAFALAGAGLNVSVGLAYLQQVRLGWPVVVQIGVPMLGLAGWVAARELLRASRDQS